jgi:hypothetical protein
MPEWMLNSQAGQQFPVSLDAHGTLEVRDSMLKTITDD